MFKDGFKKDVKEDISECKKKVTEDISEFKKEIKEDMRIIKDILKGKFILDNILPIEKF